MNTLLKSFVSKNPVERLRISNVKFFQQVKKQGNNSYYLNTFDDYQSSLLSYIKVNACDNIRCNLHEKHIKHHDKNEDEDNFKVKDDFKFIEFYDKYGLDKHFSYLHFKEPLGPNYLNNPPYDDDIMIDYYHLLYLITKFIDEHYYIIDNDEREINVDENLHRNYVYKDYCNKIKNLDILIDYFTKCRGDYKHFIEDFIKDYHYAYDGTNDYIRKSINLSKTLIRKVVYDRKKYLDNIDRKKPFNVIARKQLYDRKKHFDNMVHKRLIYLLIFLQIVVVIILLCR